ncbi:MAG: hypothetical protein B6D54_03645 [Epsilonproteobacteria bacterium 4484_65]|nr:MAG: hypothetical protein B6D54_03645 [Epsilonproteobacteria bacterium 4484_65]
MSNLLKGVIAALLIAVFTGCTSTSDIKVEALKSEKVNLDGYKTYEIIEGSGIVDGSKRTDNLNVNAEMQQIINTELTKKGKTPVTQDPDFYVAYAAGTDMDAVKEKLDAAGKKTIEKTPEAAMVLILIDAETGVIIGVSTAEGEAKGLPAEETKKRLNYAIKKMLSGL